MAAPKILIVEDEYLVATELEAVLEDWGYLSVGIAPDHKAAVELVTKGPDLALVDVNLRDGETGPTIGKLLAERGVAVIFVTANPRMLAGALGGAVGVLPKPCAEGLLGAAINYALRMREGLRLPSPPEGMLLADDLTA
jgi:DNA-binding response OmpR family regulator